MDLQRAVTLAGQFVNDESYPIVARYNQNRQIFDVLDLNETGLSAVIAWLLNPAEGHGLNDFFIKSMLRGAINSEEYSSPVSTLELESMNLHGMSVHKEFWLDGFELRVDDKSNIRENLFQELVGRLDWINSVLAGLH